MFHRAAHRLERRVDRWRWAEGGELVITAYRGLARDHEMLVKGRVLLKKHITRVTERESIWRNLVNTYRRFESDEAAGVTVRASYRDAVVETPTNDEGYFQIRLEPREVAQHLLWHEVAVEVPGRNVSTVAHVVLPAAAEFGIISDIDDTIVRTGATSVLTMVRSVINNAGARIPFPGVDKLYAALHRDRNPIFYVSSSPWNLYELLEDFMKHNRIPLGPMFLQDWGIDEDTMITAPHEQHKLEQIQAIVDYYPDMKFVLVGDNGQKDPEIYLQVIRLHPGRVLGVFIRDVEGGRREQQIIDDATTAGVEMLYVRDSDDAWTHAQRLRLLG
jgi:phosphatidate phosphatase APP1